MTAQRRPRRISPRRCCPESRDEARRDRVSSIASSPGVVLPGEARSDGFADAYRTELHKLLAQLPTRLLALLAIVGPFAFAAVLSVQSGTPTDALFGAWVHSSG